MGMLSDKPKPGLDALEQYFADDAATAALSLSESDPEAAKDALLIAAGYIRRGEVLPGNLADNLAGAIEAAMAKPPRLRAKAFTDELRLTAKNRRPASNWISIGAEVERQIKGGKNQETAIGDVEANTDISFSTIQRYWKEYVKVSVKYDAEVKSRSEKRVEKSSSQKPPTF